MARRAFVLLIAAFVAAISAGQQPTAGMSLNLNDDTESELSLQNDDGLCRLTTTDPYLHKKVKQMLKEDVVTLINYELNFPNYTRNPLTVNMAGAYDAKKWSRVTTAHGQTLLSLAFNYGVLSMMTLTLGTETLYVELQDSPPGCMEAVSDRRKIDSVRRLLMRDFDPNPNGPITTVDDGRICNEIIENDAGYAKFRHMCCYKNSITGAVKCTTKISNIWLNLLSYMLITVRISLVFFGPTLFISAVLSISKDSVPYVVKLKSKLKKTVCFYRGDTTDLPPVSAKQVLDFSSRRGFPKLQKCLKNWNVPLDQPVRVRFPQYDINVDYKRMQQENSVPVGLFNSIFGAFFKCQVRFLAPFRECCKSKIFRCSSFTITWGNFCKKKAKILLIFLIPTPFYLRLVVYYVFERNDVESRKKAIKIGNLKESFDSHLIHYFTPTHGVFLFMYGLYVGTAVALAFISQKGKDHRVKKIIINSFRELEGLNFTDTLSMIASNVVWPLENFGALGCCVGIIYWPLAVTGSLIVGAVYLLPTLYLTYRMAHHSKLAAVVMARQSNNIKYKVRDKQDLGMYQCQTDNILQRKNKVGGEFDISIDDLDHVDALEHVQGDAASVKSTLIPYPEFSWLRVIKYVSCAFLSILTLYALVLIMSEVIGCLVEIIVFTVMGCIVNASALLKYAMLVIMVVMYCGVCFNDMRKKYLKMNRALFNEVKSRIKDIDKVTSLPSSLQENCGFKAQELNEQADYEVSDDVVPKPANHWMINDLVLFVDSEDTPRIPIQLFKDVIQIQVAGVPGPIYRGQIEAFRNLAKIVLFVVFVFLVILSFSGVHKLSATDETLATLVGGSLPRMVSMFLAPPRPEVELGTVSFKSKMDEVIKNFCQYWPIYDLPFEVVSAQDGVQISEKKEDSNAVKNKVEKPVKSAKRKLLQMPEEVSVIIEPQVDIAIRLPAWPER